MGSAAAKTTRVESDAPTTQVGDDASTHRPAPPRTGRGWAGSLVTLLFVGLAFGAGWMAATARREHQSRDVMPADSVSRNRESPEVMVTVEPVVRRPVQRAVEAMGTLHGFEEVSISARVEGRVTKIRSDVSDLVKPGELLLEIDPTDYQLSVQQADRGLQVELAKLGLKEPPDSKLDLAKVPVVVKARSLMEHAKSRLERINRLAATKNVSAEDAEAAANDSRTAQAEYENQLVQSESNLATVQMKQVDLTIAREHLENTKVMAPIPTVLIPGDDGITYVVAQRSVAEGTLVRPGTEIFRLVISQTLKLRVPVPERYSSDVERDQTVQVYTATSAKPFPGTVTRIYPIVESSTRTFQVEIQVPNPDGVLKPGSFAKAAIQTRLDPDAATVPLSSIVQFAGVTKIFLVANGRAKEVPVTVGVQTTEWIEIVSPTIPNGAQVVTSGQSVIADDTRIAIRTPDGQLSDGRASKENSPNESRSADADGRGARE